TEFRVPALGFIERCICCEDDREVCAENPDCGNWPFEVVHLARLVFRIPLDPEADWNSLAAALAGLTKRPAERCGYIHRDLPRFDLTELAHTQA
ncbi:MAG: hypothetical protein KJP18_05430, partial [Gemmatimonadetes bacterium]|nr:hypothetical protein [Gemmatimonadota bacterium]